MFQRDHFYCQENKEGRYFKISEKAVEREKKEAKKREQSATGRP
jgi:protease II